MQTLQYVAVLGLVLTCAMLSKGARVDRSLKQSSVSASATAISSCTNSNCGARASNTITAADDVGRSIASALSTAVAEVEGGGDVDAAAEAFAVAIGEAFATIISQTTLSTFVSGTGFACAETNSRGRADARALARAVSSAFASSSNGAVNAAAKCYSEAVSSASVTAYQNARFSTCSTFGYNEVRLRVVTVGYVRVIATAFSYVLTSIKNNTPEATAICSAIGTSDTGVITTVRRSSRG
eukprot:g5296.t1